MFITQSTSSGMNTSTDMSCHKRSLQIKLLGSADGAPPHSTTLLPKLNAVLPKLNAVLPKLNAVCRIHLLYFQFMCRSSISLLLVPNKESPPNLVAVSLHLIAVFLFALP